MELLIASIALLKNKKMTYKNTILMIELIRHLLINARRIFIYCFLIVSVIILVFWLSNTDNTGAAQIIYDFESDAIGQPQLVLLKMEEHSKLLRATQ